MYLNSRYLKKCVVKNSNLFIFYFFTPKESKCITLKNQIWGETKEILPNISNCSLQIKIQIYSLSYTNKYIKIKIKMPQ